MPAEYSWYIGFILGAVVMSLILAEFGVEGILRFLLIIAGGIGTGWLADSMSGSGGGEG